MTIRNEFDRAYYSLPSEFESMHGTAIWAAKWMAERVIQGTQGCFNNDAEYYLFVDKVRQLEKELGQ